MSADGADRGFVARWSRRKAQARQGAPLPGPPIAPEAPAAPTRVAPTADAAATASVTTEPPHAAPPQPPSATPPAAPTPLEKEPPPTLADVAELTPESDFARFVAPGVDDQVKNAALKKLFGDPQFNVMDGLDTYIDDYGKPDPLLAADVRKMAQAAFLGLVEAAASQSGVAAERPMTHLPTCAEGDLAAARCAADDPVMLPPDEDADLRLQPHDAARRGGADAGAAADDRIEP